MKTYRTGFAIVLTVNLLLLSGIAAWWYWNRPENQALAATFQNAEAPSSLNSSGMQNTAPPGSETPLVPIQLSPQRMQSIGVRVGAVESKPVSDEIRFYGNVQADERRVAYVQTRFAGWVRQVYADATGDFVRKGQPLFTVYSPDLVTSEREYLLAKQNAAALGQSSVSGVADGAASLLDAAKARLEQFDVPDSDIAKLDATGQIANDLTFYSPVTGYITERDALPNMYVQPVTCPPESPMTKYETKPSL